MLEIISIAIIIYLLIKLWRKKDDLFFKIFFTFMNMFIVGIATVLSGLLSLCFPPVEIGRVNCDREIFSLNNQSIINGQFMLGSGYVKTDEYYYMFQRDARGGLERLMLPVSDCSIFEVESNNNLEVGGKNQQAKISWQKVTVRVSKWVSLYPGFQRTNDTKYDLIVPPNTVIQKFEVK